MKQKLFFLLAAFAFALTAKAQKPFKDIGKDNEVEVLTLSNGRYVEYFTNDTLRRIGSVMFNTVTNKVEYFIPPDDVVLRTELDRAKEVSRFMSVDPSAHKFPEMSPYNGLGNNPITTVDPDGAVIINFLLANPKHSAALTELKSGQIFNQVYTQLQVSSNVYALNSYAEDKKGVPDEAGGHFIPTSSYPNTNIGYEIGLKSFNIGDNNVIFEEVFHAGQSEFYGKNKPSTLTQEVEVRVASAFEQGVKSDVKGVSNFAKENEAYISKIKNGEMASEDEEKLFRTNVVKLGKLVAGDYDNAHSTRDKTSTQYRNEAQNYNGETHYLDSLLKKE